MQCTAKKYKLYAIRYLAYTALLAISLFFILCIAFFIYDPLQIFHKSFFDPKRLSGNLRQQAAGIINNFDFDSIILGTSVLENTSSAEASKKLGGKFVNISIAGSDLYERFFVLDRVLEKKKIAQVIYSIDNYTLDCRSGSPDFDLANWIFLYDDNPFNDLAVYLNGHYLEKLITFYPVFEKREIDRPKAWYDKPEEARRFGGLENWVSNLDMQGTREFLTITLPRNAQRSLHKRPEAKNNPQLEKKVKEYIDAYLLSPLRKAPDTRFYLIFPPYFRYYYAEMRQNNPEKFFLYQYVIRYCVEATKNLRHVEIYGFDDQEFTNKISNYKDITHYSVDINSYILDAISQKKNLLTAENVDQYLLKCDQLAYNFSIIKLNNTVRLLLKVKNTHSKQ